MKTDFSQYREFLIKVTQDRILLEKEREDLLLKKDMQAFRILPSVQSLIQLQDKLIIFISTIEHKTVLEVRDEFDFHY